MYAVRSHNINAVKTLIDCKANINIKNPSNDMSALIIAVENRDEIITQLLLESCAKNFEISNDEIVNTNLSE